MNNLLSKFEIIKPKILQDNEMDIVANLIDRGKENGYRNRMSLSFETLGEEYRLANEALHVIFLHLQKLQAISGFTMKITQGLEMIEEITLSGIDFDVLSDLHQSLLTDFAERVNGYLQTEEIDENKLYYKRGMLLLGGKSIRLGNYENKMCELLVEFPDGVQELDLEEHVYSGEHASATNPINNLVKNISRKSKPIFGRQIIENKNGYVKLLFRKE